MKQSKRKVLVITAAAGLAVFIGWKFFYQDKTNAPPSVLVRVAPAERKDIPLILREVGNVVPYESVAVRARLDSQVLEVKFKDGDAVNKGDLLFVLDDRSLKAQENELQANLRRDVAQLENLRMQYERASALLKKNFESPANLDTAKAAYKAQEAVVNATQAMLDKARVQLDYTQILAPIGGRTGTINFTSGNTVKANDTQPLVVINQIKPIRVKMSLSQNYFDAVRSAMQAGTVDVTALREGSAEASRGTLEYIDNAVDQATGTFVARATFPNEDEGLWPGMFVNITLTLGEEKQALVLPEVAVQHGQAGDYVFVIADGKASKRDIKVARMHEGAAVIAEGLQEGEQAATDGLMSLKDGAVVSIQAEK